MKYLNFLFVIECVRNLESKKDVFYLRTNDGRIISASLDCDFKCEISDFVEAITSGHKSDNVSEQ